MNFSEFIPKEDKRLIAVHVNKSRIGLFVHETKVANIFVLTWFEDKEENEPNFLFFDSITSALQKLNDIFNILKK